jgi:hypothetical protein
MTRLMEEAMRRVAELPEGQQDAVASIVLAEIEAEDIWDASYADDPDLLDELLAEGFAIEEGDEMRFLDFGD